jgi:peptidyl-prolyl cis-trans isomerase A (cyclophilin A)
MRTTTLLACLACLAAGEEELVQVKVSAELPAGDLIESCSRATGTTYLYPPADLRGRLLGGHYDLRIPRNQLASAADFLIRQCGFEVREYPPVKVVPPASALVTRFRSTGLDAEIDFDRGPGGWKKPQDAEGSLSAKCVEALLAEAATGRPEAVHVIAAMGPRTPPVVAALEKLLGEPKVRPAAAAALGRFGFHARPALPALREAAKTDPSIEEALQRIERARHPAIFQPSLAEGIAPARFVARFETTQGDFEVEVIRDWAPLAADRFFQLVRIGFFDGCRFFRVVKGFVAQFGKSPDAEVNKRWYQATFKDEPVKEGNKRGYLSFAKGEKDSRSTQVFINLGDNANLDGMGFPAFGRVVKGMDVVDKFYSGYGESPDQGKLHFEGDDYLRANFPRLDRIQQATIVE